MTQKEMIKILQDLQECTKHDGVHDKYRDGINFAIGYIASEMAFKKDRYGYIDLDRWEERTKKILNKIRKEN